MSDVIVHIPFFYNEERLEYLYAQLSVYAQLNEIKAVIVYTNNLKLTQQLLTFQKVEVRIYPYRKNFFFHQCRFLEKVHRHTEYFLFNFLKTRSFYLAMKLPWIKRFINPYYLTWEHRLVIPEHIHESSFQFYNEDDILWSAETLRWITNRYNEVFDAGFHLSCLRIEIDVDDKTWYSDMVDLPENLININGHDYALLKKPTYSASWLYTSEFLKQHLKSDEYLMRFSDYDLREKAGIGFHDTKMSYFKGVLVPIIKSGEKWKINPICHVHHLPNNYIRDPRFCNIKTHHEFSLISK